MFPFTHNLLRKLPLVHTGLLARSGLVSHNLGHAHVPSLMDKTATRYKTTTSDSKIQYIYTDAAVMDSGVGVSALVMGKSDSPTSIIRKHFRGLNNNDAEAVGLILAIIASSSHAKSSLSCSTKPSFVVRTDSASAFDASNLDTNPKGECQRLLQDKIKNFRKAYPGSILLFEWIKGHAGDAGNIRAHKEARRVASDSSVATSERLPKYLKGLALTTAKSSSESGSSKASTPISKPESPPGVGRVSTSPECTRPCIHISIVHGTGLVHHCVRSADPGDATRKSDSSCSPTSPNGMPRVQVSVSYASDSDSEHNPNKAGCTHRGSSCLVCGHLLSLRF